MALLWQDNYWDILEEDNATLFQTVCDNFQASLRREKKMKNNGKGRRHRQTVEGLWGGELAGTLAGENILHLVAIHAAPNILEMLLARGFNPNVQCPKTGQTPLHLCLLAQQWEQVFILLAHEASTSLPDHRGYNALHVACWCSAQVDCVRRMLQSVRCLLDARVDTTGFTALQLACMSKMQDDNNASVVHALLLAGCNPFAMDPSGEGQTLLHFALLHSKPAVLHLLWKHVQHSQWLEQRNKYGQTPLMLAARSGQTDGVAYLLRRAKADGLAADRQGCIPMHVAFHPPVLQLLLDYDAQCCWCQSLDGQSIFHHFCGACPPEAETEALEGLLLLHQRQPTLLTWSSFLVTSKGERPWHQASRRGLAAFLHFLCTHRPVGITLNERDNQGNTALHYAAQYNHVACVDVLLQHKVALDGKNRQGCVAADLAAQRGYTSLARRLRHSLQAEQMPYALKLAPSPRRTKGNGRLPPESTSKDRMSQSSKREDERISIAATNDSIESDVAYVDHWAETVGATTSLTGLTPAGKWRAVGKMMKQAHQHKADNCTIM
jgi:ankyrin repeat protein